MNYFEKGQCLNIGDIDTNIRKLNRTTQSVSSNMTLSVPLDNSYIVQAFLYKFEGNEFRRTPFKIIGPICDLYNEDELFVEDFIKASNFPPRGTCPIPAVNVIT